MEHRIGFFVSDWNFEAIESFTRGVRSFLEEHPDVGVVIFNDFGIAGGRSDQRGDMDIFSLPDISRLDAIMVESDRVWPADRQEMVIGQARRLGIPVASLNYPMEGCIYVGTDNYRALREMTMHVIREHQARRLAFIRGQEGSREASEREQGFLDACAQEGIASGDRICYDGAWDMEAGTRAAKEILSGGQPLPQAIICCNDDLAVGVIGVLKDAGLQVGRDVLVTGFDDLDVSFFSDPPITTVERNYARTAYAGMQALYDCLQGQEAKATVYAPFSLVRRASCGCGEAAGGKQEYEGRYLRMSRHLRQLYKISADLESAMYSAETMGDVMIMFEQAAQSMGCPNIYLAMDYNYLMRDTTACDLAPFSGQIALTAAWGEDHLTSYADPEHHIYELFEKEDLLPEHLGHGNQLLVLYPLRSDDACIGYVAADGGSPLSEFNVLQLFLQLVSSCIENTQRKRLMNQLYARVSEMSVRDPLTGLYNRFGLRTDGAAFCQELIGREGFVRFFFLDMDGMKKINDTYGHEAGDLALKAMADAIRSLGEERPCLGVRFGGDEFLFIAAMSHEEAQEALAASLVKNAARQKFPGKLAFSLGSNLVTDFAPEQMDAYVVRADDRMYEEKRAHHAQRTA